MSPHRRIVTRLLSLALLISLPCLVSAQSETTGTIAGTVRDATGAVLPGVTVEASSPALIEKTRSAVTDAQGNYKILDLRPGIYTVTVTLAGFATFKREGLELTTGFTANVDAGMRLGAVEETVTVTGASPVVDVQNVRTQLVLTRELWDALPTGKTLQAYISLTLGAQMSASGQDVGGTKGDTAGGGTAFDYHGAGRNDSSVVVDGMTVNQQTTGGGPWTRTTHQNQLAFEETTIGSGVSAEHENAGIVINLVPRDGGNIFKGTFAFNGSATRFQSNNLTPELEARGVPVQGKVTKLFDVGGGIGGPIRKDRLWFFASTRVWNAKNIIPGAFFNATPEPAFGLIPTYTPDYSRPAESGTPHHNDNLRLTWQLTNAQKVSFFGELESGCTCYRGISSSRAPEAGQDLTAPYGTKHVYQVNWNFVKGSRWLFSVGNSSYLSTRGGVERVKETSPTTIPLEDLTTGFFWNAAGDDPFPFGTCCTPFNDGGIEPFGYSHDQRYSATYSTGSHTFKVGARTQQHGSLPGTASYNVAPFGAVRLQVRGGTFGVPPVPAGVVQLINPQGPASATENRGSNRLLVTALYAQEQWTLGRMTLNMGVRYDGMHGRYEAYTTAPSDYLPSQTLTGVDDSPDWKDIVPRVGVAYDLFGNGKTAIKGSWGRFVVHETSVGASPGSRLGYGGGARTWNDLNGNFGPDCDFGNPEANGECGRLPNVNRGLATAQSTFYDPAYITGWWSRPFLWNSSVSVQHELRPGIGLTVGYFRTAYGNLTVTDNGAVVPSDYSPYCVTAPVDARLGPVSGSQLCGLYDVNPSKFGQVNNLVTHASNFGAFTNVFNGVDVSVNARFARGGVLTGGVSTGRTVIDWCDLQHDPSLTIPDVSATTPRTSGFCHTNPPWSAGTQIKLAGSYPLPWAFQVSGTFQNLPGPTYGASQLYRSAQIAPSLGRPLAAGSTATVSIPLVEPNTLYEPRFSQLDLRGTRFFRAFGSRIQAQFDVYNVLNASPVLGLSGTFGALWRRPTTILGARILKFGIQVDWN